MHVSVQTLKLSHINAGQIQKNWIWVAVFKLVFLKFKGQISGHKFPFYSVSQIITLKWTKSNAKFVKSTSSTGWWSAEEIFRHTKEDFQAVISVENYQKKVTCTVLVMVLVHKHQHGCPYQMCLDLVASTEAALVIRSQELKEKPI